MMRSGRGVPVYRYTPRRARGDGLHPANYQVTPYMGFRGPARFHARGKGCTGTQVHPIGATVPGSSSWGGLP